MRLCALLLLTAVSVWGFPQKRAVENKPNLTPLVKQLPQSKETRVREAQRDCKGKCATSIAQKAAAEAKAAQAAQNAAGAQAAHMVKTQLAEKALQAAKAAEAALAGKQAVVEQLQQELKEAEAVVSENTAAVHQQQGTVNAAIQVAQQATAQPVSQHIPRHPDVYRSVGRPPARWSDDIVKAIGPQRIRTAQDRSKWRDKREAYTQQWHKLMVQATQLSAQLEKTAHCVLEKTKVGLQEKCHNLAEARARLAHLQHKLQCACVECSATKQAAHCACEAARAACGNARKKKSVSRNQNPLLPKIRKR